jgi:WD40 repeat protein
MGPLEGHSDNVLFVAFSNDGSRVVSGSSDKTIRIWDVEAGKTVMGPLEGHSDNVLSVAFSNDGSRVVSGSNDNTIRIWDVETGKTVMGPLEGHSDSVWSVAFSNDGSRVVSGSLDHIIRIWNVETGKTAMGPLENQSNFARPIHSSTPCPGNVDNSIHIKAFQSIHGVHNCEKDDGGDVGLSAHEVCVLPIDWSTVADGWVKSPRAEVLFWAPPGNRLGMCSPRCLAVFGALRTSICFHNFKHGENWTECME